MRESALPVTIVIAVMAGYKTRKYGKEGPTSLAKHGDPNIGETFESPLQVANRNHPRGVPSACPPLFRN